jgi:ribosomal subunit interface protein
MQILIESKDVEITQQLQDHILLKLGADLDKFLKRVPDDVKVAEVRIKSGARWGYRVSFSMWLPKKEHIFAEIKHENLETAVTLLKDELQEVIRRYKEKLRPY